MLLLIVGSNITRCADKLHHLDSALLFLMLASILMRIIGLCLGYFGQAGCSVCPTAPALP